MEWFSRPLTALWGLLHPKSRKKIKYNVTPGTQRRLELRKIPFYAHVPTRHIRSYQNYIDRAFALSPSLEFEKGDKRFSNLLEEATGTGSLSVLDLEIMRMQYLLADPDKREEYQSEWAVKVINRQADDFFPSPWAILASLFAKSYPNSLHETLPNSKNPV